MANEHDKCACGLIRSRSVEFWRDGLVTNLLALVVLLGMTSFLRARVRWMRKLAVPNALVAGAFGVALGPEILGVIPFDLDQLELLVYHGFAIVFIAVGLQSPPPASRASGCASSFAVALSSIAVLQVAVGFALLLGFMVLGTALHPGFGFMPMLGFHQGPGPALALGSAWEPLGLPDGGGIGLVFAGFGFAYCVLLGVPLVWWGRRAGWITPPSEYEIPAEATVDETSGRGPTGGPISMHGIEPLSAQIMAIGCVYAVVFGLLMALTSMLPDGSGIGATLWGFNFIIGSLVAIAVRRTTLRMKVSLPLDDPMLSRVAVVAVDFTTVAALAAVRVSILDRWLVPILVMTATTGVLALLASVWLARRAFPQAPFEHAVTLFGATTGTLPTGLALLRTLDPELRGPVARNVVLGATGSIPLTGPMMLLVIPICVELWPRDSSLALWAPLVMMAVYAALLILAWRWITPFRWLRPPLAPWPAGDRATAPQHRARP
jgi:glutamate:Na+ symporter, ESS family